ncbi:MAG: cyclic di-GMP phosphodiesterase [Solirubrobacteraceae bacterium]|nr:cyclic di-GMP phosphodiesterase [Solirubrobacteraceae bacterium]
MEALSALRILVAGDDPKTVEAARSGLAAEGAQAEVCSSDALAVAALARIGGQPAAVIALDGSEAALRAGLDPLGLETGPPVVPLREIAADGEAFAGPAARRLRALVQLHSLRARNRELEGVIAAQAVSRRREVQAAQLDGLMRLAEAAEYRDDNTREHTQRVGHVAALLARKIGLGDRMVWLVRQAAPLHDLGKIAIPDSILLKPGKLSDEEFDVVKTHALLGARVLAGAETELLEVAERIVRHHHERWDGGGYPDGLVGEDIPAVARITAVADVFDVLVHERPYKDSWTTEAAVDEIRAGAGTQFDPDVVTAFEELGPAAWEEDAQRS